MHMVFLSPVFLNAEVKQRSGKLSKTGCRSPHKPCLWMQAPAEGLGHVPS